MSDEKETPRETIDLSCTFSLAPKDALCLRTHLGDAKGKDEHEGRDFMISMSGGAIVIEEPGNRYVTISLADILKQGVQAIDCLSTVERLFEDHGDKLKGQEADMDELIHDHTNQEGSNVNNDGIRAQITFLAEQVGAVEAERLVRETFELEVV